MPFSGYDYDFPSFFFRFLVIFSITLLLFYMLLLAVVQTLLVWIWLSKLLTKITPKNLYYFYFHICMVTLFLFFMVHGHTYVDLYTWSSLWFAMALPSVVGLSPGSGKRTPSRILRCPQCWLPFLFTEDSCESWGEVIWVIRVEILVFCRE